MSTKTIKFKEGVYLMMKPDKKLKTKALYIESFRAMQVSPKLKKTQLVKSLDFFKFLFLFSYGDFFQIISLF